MWRQIRILIKVGMEMKGQQYLLQRTFGPQPINTNINPLDLFWQQLQTTYLRCLFSKTSLGYTYDIKLARLAASQNKSACVEHCSFCSFYHRSCKMLVVTLWFEFLNEGSIAIYKSSFMIEELVSCFSFVGDCLLLCIKHYICRHN